MCAKVYIQGDSLFLIRNKSNTLGEIQEWLNYDTIEYYAAIKNRIFKAIYMGTAPLF